MNGIIFEISEGARALKHWWLESLAAVPETEYQPALDIGGFLTVSAFSVAIYTLSSPKYQIRLNTAPIPFKSILFMTLLLSGFTVISSELIVRLSIRVPRFLDLNLINFLIAVSLTGLILYWLKVCFYRPPKYGSKTAKRFRQIAFSYIINGSEEEMFAFAGETMREMGRIIEHCPSLKPGTGEDKDVAERSDVEQSTLELIYLLADSRFCDLITEKLPSFPAHLMDTLVAQKRYELPTAVIIKRFVVAFLSNKNSAIHIENEWLSNSYVGQVKPITWSIFGSWHLFERLETGLDSPLDFRFRYNLEWDTETWRTYFGCCLVYIEGLIRSSESTYFRSDFRNIIGTAEGAFDDLGIYNNTNDRRINHEIYFKAKYTSDFLNDMLKLVEDSGKFQPTFNHLDKYHMGRDISSELAGLFFKAIEKSAENKSHDFMDVWTVQHNLVWTAMHHHETKDLPIMRMTRRKVRRHIWNEVRRMDKSPNYVGAKLISYCVNVFGFYDSVHPKSGGSRSDYVAISKLVTRWLKSNYTSLAETHPPVAEACLPFNVVYDAAAKELVRTKEDPLTGKLRVTVLSL